MNTIIGFLHLVRVKNLGFVILAQLLLRYFVIEPRLGPYAFVDKLSEGNFLLLVLSTVLITAAGYIINDYFDVGIDSVNKPKKIVIGKIIHRRTAMTLHLIFNFLGIALGFYLGWKLNNYKLGYFHFMVAGLLWFYSTSFKRTLFLGNLIVSILTSLVIMIVVFYEPRLYSNLSQYSTDASKTILRIILAYAYFAFMVSMIREIVKDTEDVEGDAELDCRTIPVVFGIKWAKIVSAGFTFIVIGSLGYIQVLLIKDELLVQLTYLLITVQLPLIYVLYLLRQAQTKDDFHKISYMIKLTMFTGLTSMIFFYQS
ncbi:MAG: geranylgeranylglycerol-phosphate geranylgeranyltransferase [Bacteroidetes bacterium]|nr:geranylgeranylglycerol-phosphate geranylgeranyltransferase [Bacteroidota bacterium]